MKKLRLAGICFLFLISGLSTYTNAAGIGFGYLTGFGSCASAASLSGCYQYGFTFVNDYSSTADIESIIVDGSMAFNRDLTWSAGIGAFTGGGGVDIDISGVDSQQILLSVNPLGSTFSPGELIENSGFYPYPDAGLVATPASDLLGVQVTFNFSDSSAWSGILLDIPAAPGSPFPNGIAYLQAVPVPAAAWLFGSGLLGLAGMSRRKNVSVAEESQV